MDSPRRALVVDAANVVGSVPDGWWRDRAGAAARLCADIAAALAAGSLNYDEVVVVLEGRARSGLPESSVPAEPVTGPAVRVVHAPASGDDEIVAQCRHLSEAGADVTLASADRGLIARVQGLAVAVVGPRTIRPY